VTTIGLDIATSVAEVLIDIAHPKFREQLERAVFKFHSAMSPPAAAR
jgi:acyl-CoA hydrolase